MQVMTSETLPLPIKLKHLQAIICTCQATPTTPLPLLPTAPSTPATNVPWTGEAIVAWVVVTRQRIPPMAAIVRIVPHVGREIFMRVPHPRIQDGHDDVAGGSQHIPGFGRVYVRVGCPAILAVVVQSPECTI